MVLFAVNTKYLKKTKTQNIFQKALALFTVCNKCNSKDKKHLWKKSRLR